MAVGGALLRQRRRLVGRQVFEPVGGFLRRARAHVDREIGFAHRSARTKSMNSCVPNVFGSITPPQLALSVAGALARADAVAPVIFVGEAPARPAHVGHRSALSAATTSLRIPRVLGIDESGPTQTPS